MKEKESENTLNSKKSTIQADSENSVSLFQSFKESIGKKQRSEDQLRVAISFMKEALLDSKKPRFKDFWSAQRICSLIFKEKMGQTQRHQLWSEYVELLKEARCLKGIVEEDATFSHIQIELAVEDLEKETESLDTQKELPDNKPLPPSKNPYALKKDEYRRWSDELVILKSAASRLVSLRKEFLGLSLQGEKRKKLLNRLDKLGDVIFPRRKKLIERVSASFIQDIEDFVTHRCMDQTIEAQAESKKSIPYYILQGQIKSFQAFAKTLQLNRTAFNKARILLTKAWDSLIVKEVESKSKLKELSRQQQENFENISKKVLDFQTFCQDPANLVKEKIVQKKEALLKEVRSLMLKKESFSALVADIKKVEQGSLAKIEEKIIQKRNFEEKKIKKLKETLSKLIEERNSHSFEELESQQAACISEYTTYELNPLDKLTLEDRLLDLKSCVLDKKTEKLALKKEIEMIYGDRLDLLQEVKNKIEIYRKEMRKSALDIEKALIYRELNDSAKIHLNKENLALKNLEEKFSNLES